MEAAGIGIQYTYDRVKHATRMQTDRATAPQHAMARAAGSAAVRQRNILILLDRMSCGQIDTAFLATHPMRLS